MEKERWKDDFCRRHGIRPKFENMDFFVTNVEFAHDDASSSWRVREVKKLSFLYWPYRIANDFIAWYWHFGKTPSIL